jgi:hypothetical protein
MRETEVDIRLRIATTSCRLCRPWLEHMSESWRKKFNFHENTLQIQTSLSKSVSSNFYSREDAM